MKVYQLIPSKMRMKASLMVIQSRQSQLIQVKKTRPPQWKRRELLKRQPLKTQVKNRKRLVSKKQ